MGLHLGHRSRWGGSGCACKAVPGRQAEGRVWGRINLINFEIGAREIHSNTFHITGKHSAGSKRVW